MAQSVPSLSSPSSLPPGPRTPALWQTARFVVDPHGYTRKIVARYGDAFRAHATTGRGIAVASAELSREVFAGDPENFAVTSLVGDIFGRRAVIATAGARHRRQRKLMNPRFHGARIKSFLAAMQRVTEAHLANQAATPDAVVVMNLLTQSLTVDIILETIFGADLGLDRARGRTILTEAVGAVTPSVIGWRFLRRGWFAPWRNFEAARGRFDAWIDEMLAARKRGAARGETGDDMLGLLLDARDEDGAPMDDAEIRDQMFTLLVAGHETTATAISWGVYHLARQPEVLAKLRGELDALGPGASPESIAKAPYLSAVVSESLRIEPVVTDVVRVCRNDFPLGGYVVPAGQTIFVLLCAVLRDPRLFPEPTVFRPERFLERTFTAAEFAPFGGGSRRCLGAAFAESEMALVLASIARDWEVTLADSEPETCVRRNLTMGPKHGVRVRLRRRALSGRT
jgi:cytochrome P450